MRHSHRLLAVFVGLALASSACVKGSKGLTGEDKERLASYVLSSPPANIPHPLDVNFEDKIHLIGYKVEPEIAPAGTDVKITYYWRCDEAPGEGWLLFTHLEDNGGEAKDNLDWNGPLREKPPHEDMKQILGPSRWEKGKTYVDEQSFKVPEGFKGDSFIVFGGFWKANDNSRLHVIGNGPHDKDNRAIIARIRTGQTRPIIPVPTMTAVKLSAGEKIVLDGKADEKAWATAATTGPLGDVMTGQVNPASPITGQAKLAWDDQNLYAYFEVHQPEPYVGFTDAKSQPGDFTASGQPKLWGKDTVEMMIDPDGDGDNKDYYEIQINPQNKIFKTQYDSLHSPVTPAANPTMYGHEDWDAKIKSVVFPIKSTDGKQTIGYTVEAAIPWASFSKAANHPPKPGDTWRANLYAMKDGSRSTVSWSPLAGAHDFHIAQRFGKITWSLTAAAPATTPAAAVAATTPGTTPSTAVAAAPAAKSPPAGPGAHPSPRQLPPATAKP